MYLFQKACDIVDNKVFENNSITFIKSGTYQGCREIQYLKERESGLIHVNEK